MRKKDLKIGQQVYIIETYTDFIHRYKVMGFKTDPKYGEYVSLNGDEKDCVGTIGRPFDKVYPTKEAAQAALQAKDEEIRNQYRDEIKSVQDLIQFMYDYTVSCAEEYTDWNARNVAKEKAAEFGFPIQD